MTANYPEKNRDMTDLDAKLAGLELIKIKTEIKTIKVLNKLLKTYYKQGCTSEQLSLVEAKLDSYLKQI